MTILPYEGFIRRDRALKPSAPSRDLADSITKGGRHGLPDIRPTPVASAPELADGDRRKFRRIATPPADVDRRGVVTRNPNADSGSLLGGHRERRAISDNRAPAFEGNDQAGQERQREKAQRREQQRQERQQQQQQGGADSGGEPHSQKIRVPLQSSSEGLNVDGAGRDRKRNRDEDRSTENDAARQRYRAEERARPSDTGASTSSGQQNDQARQDRHQEKQERREQQRQERRQEQQRQQEQQPEQHHQERQQQQAQQPEHHHHQEQQQQEQRKKNN
jgi:hypothetical protein